MDLFEEEIRKKLKEAEEKKSVKGIAFENLTESAKKKAVQIGLQAMGKPHALPPTPQAQKTPPKPSKDNRMATDRSRHDKGK